MTPLRPDAIPHSRLTLPSVSLLQGKAYTPAVMHAAPIYLNGRNGLLVKQPADTRCVLLADAAAEYQREAIESANSAMPDDETSF